MRKYRVFMRGENFLMKLEGRSRKMGFFVARFVEARDEEEAACAAVEALRADPELRASMLNEGPDAPLVYAEEIEEWELFDAPLAKGFTFYPEE